MLEADAMKKRHEAELLSSEKLVKSLLAEPKTQEADPQKKLSRNNCISLVNQPR